MRAFWIVLVVLLIGVLINAVRDGAEFPLVQTLPLLGGDRPSWLWDGATMAMLLITCWGIRRLYRRS